MNDYGLFIVGTFIGCNMKEKRRNDGSVYNVYSYLLAIDDDAYKISSEYDYRGDLGFGDKITFKIRVNAFNNQAYYHGVLVS